MGRPTSRQYLVSDVACAKFVGSCEYFDVICFGVGFSRQLVLYMLPQTNCFYGTKCLFSNYRGHRGKMIYGQCPKDANTLCLHAASFIRHLQCPQGGTRRDAVAHWSCCITPTCSPDTDADGYRSHRQPKPNHSKACGDRGERAGPRLTSSCSVWGWLRRQVQLQLQVLLVLVELDSWIPIIIQSA